jgi:hypothetical protein
VSLLVGEEVVASTFVLAVSAFVMVVEVSPFVPVKEALYLVQVVEEESSVVHAAVTCAVVVEVVQ